MHSANTLIGRTKEKLVFQKILESKKAEFLAVYGRRRVGKTFAIRQFFKEKILVEFSGSLNESIDIQLFNFKTELNRIQGNNNQTPKLTNWAEAFAALTDYLYSSEKTKQKFVIFIDELPWMDTPKGSIVSAIDYFWNQHGSKMDNLVFIVCGSAASWIQKYLINAKGGLYNRVTSRIFLQPFSLQETEAFCLSRNLKFTRYQIVQIYMAMGGIPFYLNEIEQGQSVNQLIDKICFQKGGLLSDEFKPLYQSLFKNAENHIKIIEALASYPYGMIRKDLVDKAGVAEGGTFSRTIENLIDCGLVIEIIPFGKKLRDKVYRIIDLYSIFYLKFIRGNVTERTQIWESLAATANFASWSGYAFENICMLHLEQIHQKLGISGVYTQVSSWRHQGDAQLAGAQIDIVIERKDGIIHLCEAKFSSKEYLLTKEYTMKLRKRRALFEHKTGTKKAVVTTLISSYPAIQNEYYSEEIHSEILLDNLFFSRE